MKILFLFFVLLFFKFSSGQLDGLFLGPEMLKTGVEIIEGNDYMDYDPAHHSRFKKFVVIDVPAKDLEIVVEEEHVL